VTNHGDAPSAPVAVSIAAQGTTADVPLRAAQWRPLGDATIPAIAPGATAELRLPWQPPRVPAAATGWGLRATLAERGGERRVVLSSVGQLSRPNRIDAIL